MDSELQKKAKQLIASTRVMTLSVIEENIPWSTPVYFVFHNGGFYFFSNEKTRHIRCASGHQKIAASIFHDSDTIQDIFGFQMPGVMAAISKQAVYLMVVKKYVSKFGFLQKAFGSQLWENKRFFLERFKSKLYVFKPDRIFLSDNSKSSDKRSEISLEDLMDLE